MNDAPRIQVYCTVREDELSAGTGGLTCTRCMKTLVDLNDPAAVAAAAAKGGGPSCGFIRRLAVPALASSLMLSACGDGGKPRNITAGVPMPPPGKQEGPDNGRHLILGRLVPPVGETSAEYPTAAPVPGKPGFVTSPYNGMTIDVADLPAGKLAADPSYPMSEKKYFRVPKEQTPTDVPHP